MEYIGMFLFGVAVIGLIIVLYNLVAKEQDEAVDYTDNYSGGGIRRDEGETQEK